MINLFIALVLTSFQVFAQADSKGGGGGATVVCKNSDGTIKTVKLLDLYQIEMNSRTVPRSQLNWKKQLNSILLKKKDQFVANDIFEVLEKVKVKMLPLNITLRQPYDLGNDSVLIEDGCTIEWVAFYKDGDDSLQIVAKYFNLMGPTDKAALFLHEAIYKMFRKREDTNSSRTREVVGEIFARDTDHSRLDKLTNSIWGCYDKCLEFDRNQTPILKFVVTSRQIKNGLNEASFRVDCSDSSFNIIERKEVDITTSNEEGTVSKELYFTKNCRRLNIVPQSWNDVVVIDYILNLNGKAVFVDSNSESAQRIIKLQPKWLGPKL